MRFVQKTFQPNRGICQTLKCQLRHNVTFHRWRHKNRVHKKVYERKIYINFFLNLYQLWFGHLPFFLYKALIKFQSMSSVTPFAGQLKCNLIIRDYGQRLQDSL